jgi:hypothetical protein
LIKIKIRLLPVKKLIAQNMRMKYNTFYKKITYKSRGKKLCCGSYMQRYHIFSSINNTNINTNNKDNQVKLAPILKY